jgi:hypothetical protein
MHDATPEAASFSRRNLPSLPIFSVGLPKIIHTTKQFEDTRECLLWLVISNYHPFYQGSAYLVLMLK